MTLSLAQRFRRDKRGVSAVEFALIAPLMLFCYLGVSVLCSALLVERKASHVASAMGDLTSQMVTIAPSDFTDICTAANTIMAPYDVSLSSLQMRITILNEDSAGKVTVGRSWPCNTGNPNLPQLATGSSYSGPATTLLSPGQGLIMSEVDYTYNSPLKTLNISWLPGSHAFTDVFYLQPRQSVTVTCPTCTG